MKLQAKIINYLQYKYNAYAVNVVVAGKAGTPDIVACIKGKFYGFEVKTGFGRLTPLQKVHLAQIADADGYGNVVRSLEDVDYIVENNVQYKEKIKIIEL